MKTIFICIPTLASAGAERFVTELACNIDRSSYKPVVVVTKLLDNNSAFYKKLRSCAVTVAYIEGKSYISKANNLVKLIKQEKPCIIHTNVGASLHLLIPIIISGTKAKHLFTTHSMGYRIFGGIKKRIIEFEFKHKKIIPVAICHTVQQSIVEAYHLKKEDIELIYNGVDTSSFVPTEEKHSVFTVITTGRLSDVKNQTLLKISMYN